MTGAQPGAIPKYAWQRASVRELPGVLATAGRLILAHWPALLALAFLGVAVRNAALWAAVLISNWNAFVAQLVLVFAPLGYLMPVIAMLHLCRRSLTNVREIAEAEGPEAPTEHRERRLVDVTVSMVVPFLVVYAAYGLLKADQDRFVNEAAADELFSDTFTPGGVDFAGRVGFYGPLTLLAIVVVAWFVRWGLGRLEGRTRFLGLAAIGAMVEVYWASLTGRHAPDARETTVGWLEQRQVVRAMGDWYDGAVAGLGRSGDAIDRVLGWLLDLVGSLDTVIVVPLAWLTVASVVLGHKLAPAPTRKHRWLDKVEVLPASVLQAAGSFTNDLRERWSAFWHGLRLLWTAGLYPMLLFCLIFLVVIRIPYALSLLVRWIAGPTDTDTWLAFAPMEGAFVLALTMAVTAPLLAAAVEWLVAPTPVDRTGQQPATEAPGRRSPTD